MEPPFMFTDEGYAPSLSRKYQTRAEKTDRNKPSSLLQYGNNYVGVMFYGQFYNTLFGVNGSIFAVNFYYYFISVNNDKKLYNIGPIKYTRGMLLFKMISYYSFQRVYRKRYFNKKLKT